MPFLTNRSGGPEINTLSLHDALPICTQHVLQRVVRERVGAQRLGGAVQRAGPRRPGAARDRKSTRLNSSHSSISYAVFCLKKKTQARVDRSSLTTPLIPDSSAVQATI